MNSNLIFKLKERFFKQFFLFQDKMRLVLSLVARISDIILIFGGMMFATLLIIHIGFSQDHLLPSSLGKIFRILFLWVYIAKYSQEFIRFKFKKRWAQIIDVAIFIFCTLILRAQFATVNDGSLNHLLLASQQALLLGIGIIFITEIYKLSRIINAVKISPPLLFALSFLLLIFIGSGLLMLPESHLLPISYLDALFTSASAVCVTGLVVVDTATAYSMVGQTIIISLIQIGGLGIMAFTGFFAFAFTGTVSFKDRILLRDVFSEETLGGIFRTLAKIIIFTFSLEIIGAAIIYFHLDGMVKHPLFFSIFHSISAFCNAGFSTLEGGMASELLAGKTIIFITISSLVIMGGIGFPVLITFYARSKFGFFQLLRIPNSMVKPARYMSKNIAERIVIIVTVALLIGGTLIYYVLERNNSMANTAESQRWLIAFFGSMSSRTAGFNMIDMTAWRYPTILAMILLMWIGASPGSTGGGIKTTTFGVALQAVYHFIRGRHTVEIGYRRIGTETISRVLIVIVLSIITISAAFFALLITDPQQNPMYVLFETVSAFSTVGLSLADTSTYTHSGQIIIMILMFIGRVGPLTLLSGIFISHRKKYYQYPEQDLIIN